jgi:hypothetical protein
MPNIRLLANIITSAKGVYAICGRQFTVGLSYFWMSRREAMSPFVRDYLKEVCTTNALEDFSLHSKE